MDDYTKAYRVWWNRGGVEYEFFVDSVDEAKPVIRTLTALDLQDGTLDWNAGGLEEHDRESQEWNEWYNDYGESITEVIEEEDKR